MTVTDVKTWQAPETATPDSIKLLVEQLRGTFRSGRTKPYAWRVDQLNALERMMVEREDAFVEALGADLGRNAVDAWMADVAPVKTDAAYARKHLRRWMKKTSVGLPMAIQPGRAWYQHEPLGVVLIIAPWNYPAYLALSPLVGAIAAGNCAIIKPSENTPAVSALLAKLLPDYLDRSAFRVVEGAAETTQCLLDQGLDYAFFTGSPEVGKIVMAAAAKHLTPVTLELGGKSPVIVAADAAVAVAARRVAWAKQFNSGQTCVAPDYVLVERSVRDEFVSELNKAFDAMRAGEPDALPIINERQAARLFRVMAGAGGKTVRGGAVDVQQRKAEFTVVLDPAADSELMTGEIFGPLLPIVTVDSMDDAIARVLDGPKPLALYLFSSSKSLQRRILAEISNGATMVNHLMYHVLVPSLPFGGVGNSGMGAYHGKFGYETFSHRKSVLRKPIRPDLSLAYPPYNDFAKKVLRRMF